MGLEKNGMASWRAKLIGAGAEDPAKSLQIGWSCL
jgi:hypothetical protein